MNNKGSNSSAGRQHTVRRPIFTTFAGLAKRKSWWPFVPRPALILPLFLLLPGCAVGPNYKRPNVAAPTVFRGPTETAQQASFADLPWWEIFHDETLTELVKTALSNNYDLTAAVARVEQANQVAAQARSQYFPTLGYSTYTSLRHNQFIYSPLNPPNGSQGFLLALAPVSWEADLWGRVRRPH